MKNFSWLIACLLTLSVTAQEKIVALGKAPNSYIKHKVAEGEALSTIANQYGGTSAQLAKFNGLKAGAILKKGVILKIPLTRNNLAQGPSATFNEPVYHTIVKGDNLFHISQSFHNVNIQSLRDWNNLKKDVVRDGQLLIVGYIKGGKKGGNSNVAEETASTTNNSNTTPPAAKTNTLPLVTKKNTVDAGKNTAEVIPKETAQEMKPEIKKPVTAATPANTATAATDAGELKYVPRQGDEGYFAIPFAQHDHTQTQQFRSGDIAIFKTISGWTDRKYYVLMNDIAPGTVVRITAPGNKSICAKVLGALVETKGAAGLLLRMSNSAAMALDIVDGKSTVSVTYFE